MYLMSYFIPHSKQLAACSQGFTQLSRSAVCEERHGRWCSCCSFPPCGEGWLVQHPLCVQHMPARQPYLLNT